MRALTILLIHNYYKIRGGEDHCFEEEVELLRAAGHKVIEYTRHNDEIDAQSKLTSFMELFWSSRSAQDVAQILSTQKVDVVHVHNFMPLISPSVYEEANKRGVPVVQTLHNYRLACANALLLRDGKICEKCVGSSFGYQGVLYKCYRSSRAASLSMSLMTSVHRWIGTWENKVDCFIAPSQFVRHKMIEHGLNGEKIRVRANVVSLGREYEVKERSGAVYVGRLSAEKGVDLLIRCWRESFPSRKLTIVGAGPEELVLKELAVGGNIEFVGVQSREACLELLATAEMLVMPSVCFETFGRTVVEAYSVGTPVIVPSGGALEELVVSESLGRVFELGSVESLREAIDVLGDVGAEREREIKEHYQKHFSHSLLCEETLQIYRSLIR